MPAGGRDGALKSPTFEKERYADRHLRTQEGALEPTSTPTILSAG